MLRGEILVNLMAYTLLDALLMIKTDMETQSADEALQS